MKTTLDIINILYNHLKTGALKNAINGDVYKQKRPANSQKEDVVINCLPVNNEQLSQAIANVNVYVPDLIVTVNNIQDRQPHLAKLESLATIATGMLKENWQSGVIFSLQQQVVIEDLEAGAHYINFRIEFNLINL